MPFPNDVRTEALLRAARHCCVCRLPKGTALEVHHLQPEADGGSNTIENAIPLCFDCHANAGHYNSRHPRGTKFSPAELVQHRDRWYAAVQQHGIEAAGDPGLAFQYLIISDATVNSDLLTHDVGRLPLGKNTILFDPGRVTDFQKKELLRSLRGFNVGTNIEAYTQHPDYSSYLRVHPDARSLSEDYGTALRRPVTLADLERIGAPQLAFIEEADASGAELDDLCWVTAHRGGCGDGGIYERWTLPSFVTVSLMVTNVAQAALTISNVRGLRERTDDSYAPRRLVSHPLSAEEGNEVIPFPPAQVLPGQTVIVPVASAYNFGETMYLEHDSLIVESIARGAYQNFAAVDSTPVLARSWIVGPAFWPLEFQFRDAGRLGRAAVHGLQPTLTYSVQRGVEYGSCPHVFVRREGGHWVYLRPALVAAVRCMAVDRIELPAHTSEVAIVELEHEETLVKELRVGARTRRDVVLRLNDVLLIDTHGCDLIEVHGLYAPLAGAAARGQESSSMLAVDYFKCYPHVFNCIDVV